MKALVTGNLGFIGSNLTLELAKLGHEVIGIDSCNKQSNPAWLVDQLVANKALRNVTQFTLKIDDYRVIDIIEATKPDVIFHLAAESHVDNCQADPMAATMTNVLGTQVLLEAVRACKKKIRFVHVSTDEVFGELKLEESPFSLDTKYAPRSVYAASKAAADHYVRAYGISYGLDVIVTNCTNNYGPNQYKEKLIPRVVSLLLAGESITVNGTGKQIRDWIYVKDHVRGLIKAAVCGISGSTYLFGGKNEITNLDMIEYVHRAVEENTESKFELKLKYVNNRPHDDFRYAIDVSQTEKDLNWTPSADFNFRGLLDITVIETIKQLQNLNLYSIDDAMTILEQGGTADRTHIFGEV